MKYLSEYQQSGFLRIAAFLALVIWFVHAKPEPRVKRGAKYLSTTLETSLACGFTAGFAIESANDDLTKRVLLVTGIDHPAHKWQQTASVLAEVLQKEPRLQVRIVEDPHFLDSSALHRYSAVVLHFMNWEEPAPQAEARENLRRFVNDGGGLVLIHFACGAFQDWPEFLNLAGRVWNPKLRGHDPRGPFRVDIVDEKHSITQELQTFETDDELYTCLAGDRPIKVLATAKSKVDGKDYPMAFVFDYGKGRVFHSLLGHDVKAISNPNVSELFRRGCAWAAKLDVFPEKKQSVDKPR